MTADSGALDCRELVRDFSGFRAVDGVSLRVKPGEVVGLLGPNGAGKTTTLRMVAGLVSPTAGQVFIDGIDVATNPFDARRKLGFLTGSTGLYERLSPRELLQIFGELQGLEKAALTRRIDALARELDLTAFLDVRCGVLSSGQRQRVSIARAIVHDPALYVFDEPTSALDPLAAESILLLVRSARERQRAVLFSTHRMDEAELLCDRIAFMRGGRIVAEGSSESLREGSGERSLAAAFLYYAREPAQ